jgi:hypothetical protein
MRAGEVLGFEWRMPGKSHLRLDAQQPVLANSSRINGRSEWLVAVGS